MLQHIRYFLLAGVIALALLAAAPLPAVTRSLRPAPLQQQKEEKKDILSKIGLKKDKKGTAEETQKGATNWKEELEEQLKSTYAITELGLDRLRITKPGSVLVIQVEGIGGDLASDATFSRTKVHDGQIKQEKGIVPFLKDKKTTRIFRPSERVYLFKVDVQNEEILFYVVSCETYGINVQGSSQQTRYKSLIDFQFPKNYLATANFDKVKGVIDTVLASEKGISTAGPKTIELGQTVEQVESILGKPEKISKLGPKTTYFYKDMKVIFVDGKLTDVQ